MTDPGAAAAASERGSPQERGELSFDAAKGLFPTWVRVLDAVHGCARSPWALAVDGLVVGGAALVAGTGPVVAAVLAAVVLATFDIAGVYTARSCLETQGLSWYPARVGTPFALVALATLVAAGWIGSSGVPMAWAIVGAGGALVAVRTLAWVVLSRARRAGLGRRAALVVGSGAAARLLLEKLAERPDAGLEPVGLLTPAGSAGSAGSAGTLASGTLASGPLASGPPAESLPDVIRQTGIAHVLLAPEGDGDVDVAECLTLCQGLDVDVSVRPPLGDLFLRPGVVSQVGGVSLVTLSRMGRPRLTRPGKRAFDLLAGGALLAVFLPLMALTTLLILLDDGRPVLFRQRRVGHQGTVFSMLKFRSMVVGAEQLVLSLRDRNSADGLLFKIRDDPRVTRVGRFIRRHSIDELPQLWNVIRGDMSLVGPRPLPVRPEDFGPLDGQRHVVPPGITGYWQTAPGSGLTYREMVRLDLAYVREWSLWLDLAILARTVPALLRRYREPNT